MRIFFSHSFAPELETRVEAFRQILATAKREIEAESDERVEVVEGDKADVMDPVNSIFPKIEDSNVLFTVLLAEHEDDKKISFVSPACLQEIVVAHHKGRRALVWVEKGRSKRLGFTQHLTTYGEFTDVDLLLEQKRRSIIQNLKDTIIRHFQPSAAKTDGYLYFNSFNEESRDKVRSYSWRRAESEEPRTGGQQEISFGGESGEGCLLIAVTDDAWNHPTRTSIATLAQLDPTHFENGQSVIFEIRGRSTGPIRVRPYIDGPAVDPEAPRDRDKWVWDICPQPGPDGNWDWKAIKPEEEWVSKVFVGRVQYPQEFIIKRRPTLDLLTDTGVNALFVDRVMFGLQKEGSDC
jgi:hypothetical protein